MKVSVLICSRNRKDLLRRAVQALWQQACPMDDFEIIAVDDGSEDGTSEMVSGLIAESPCSMKLITQPYRQGLASGRNRAIREAAGEYIIFIDDDIIADKNFIAEHIRFHEKYPKSVVKGWVNHTPDLERKVPKFNRADISTAFFWTSNVSVSRQALLDVGLFDEDFKEYGWEDLELGLRLKEYGLTSRYNKKALVFHYKGHWKKGDISRMIAQSQAKARTAIIFIEKNPSMRVKMATALYPFRIWLNRMLNRKDKGIAFCEKVLSKHADDEVLKGFPLLCAQNLITFHYFKEIDDKLRTLK